MAGDGEGRDGRDVDLLFFCGGVKFVFVGLMTSTCRLMMRSNRMFFNGVIVGGRMRSEDGIVN